MHFNKAAQIKVNWLELILWYSEKVSPNPGSCYLPASDRRQVLGMTWLSMRLTIFMLLWMRARERAVSPLCALLNTFTPFKENHTQIFKTIFILS